MIPGTLGLVYILRRRPPHLRRFAVKTINPAKLERLPKVEAVARFKREVEHWYLYRHHPLILRPFFIEVVNNWPFIAMQYGERTLREIIQEETSIPQMLAIAVEIAHAFGYATKKGLIAHQDLKPENILLQDVHQHFFPPHPIRWRVQLADFGLANAYAELGTPYGSRPYMAPEQYSLEDDFSLVDVFATGVIFTEMFSGGYHPIGVRTADVWPAAREGFSRNWIRETKWKEWIRRGSTVNANIDIQPDAVRHLIGRMLALVPDERPRWSEVENTLMGTLHEADPNLHTQMEVLLEYFDQLAQESEADDQQTNQEYEREQLRKFGRLTNSRE